MTKHAYHFIDACYNMFLDNFLCSVNGEKPLYVAAEKNCKPLLKIAKWHIKSDFNLEFLKQPICFYLFLLLVYCEQIPSCTYFYSQITTVQVLRK